MWQNVHFSCNSGHFVFFGALNEIFEFEFKFNGYDLKTVNLNQMIMCPIIILSLWLFIEINCLYPIWMKIEWLLINCKIMEYFMSDKR